MVVTRYAAHEPGELREGRLDWTWVEFHDIKIKGRKVFRLYGAEELQYICVKPTDDPSDEKYTLMFYSVGFPETDTEPLIEVVATLNNKKPSRQWSRFSLNIVCRATKGEIKLKQLKQTEVPTMKLVPRCPIMSKAFTPDMPKQNTIGKGDPPTAKEALAFLDQL